MYRQRVNAIASRKSFAAASGRTKKINVNPYVPRGGIRL